MIETLSEKLMNEKNDLLLELKASFKFSHK